jgi:hypothetical protein
VRKGIPLDSIELLSAPDSSFNPANLKILNDNVVGNPSGPKNKKWYGFKNHDGIYLLVFKEQMEISQVQGVFLRSINENIFPAQSIEVWGGMDRKNMKLLSKLQPAIPTGYDPSSIIRSNLSCKPSTVKYVKLVIHPLKKIPNWHHNKGKPALAMVGEIVVN